MVHSVNDSRAITPKMQAEIEDCHSILMDVLGWLFESKITLHSTEVKTRTEPAEERLHYPMGGLHPDDYAFIKESAVAASSLFKIVVELDRRKVLSLVMDKLSPEQQAELSAYLMRTEHARR